MHKKFRQRAKIGRSEIFWPQNPVLLKTIVLPESKSNLLLSINLANLTICQVKEMK